MKNVIKALSLLASTAIFFGCAGINESTFSHIDKIDMEIPGAPDVHGANGYQENKAAVRGNINVSIAKKEHINVSNVKNPRKRCELGDCKVDTPLGKSDYIETTYSTKGINANAGIEGLFKVEQLLLGIGVQYNNGIYSHISMGVNTKHFEAGVLGGLWVMNRDEKHTATEYTCTSGFLIKNPEITEKNYFESSDKAIVTTYGLYASLYHGPLFITYSLNAYKPTFDSSKYDTEETEGADADLPYVLTHHISVGYRFTKALEYHIGLTRINGDFESPAPEINTGISVYML